MTASQRMHNLPVGSLKRWTRTARPDVLLNGSRVGYSAAADQ
ncbi:hypothetical protein ACFV0Y_07495 [Streptomyces sp. NPDC059569]